MKTEESIAQTTRRDFIRTAGAAGAGLYLSGVSQPGKASAAKLETLALNGGPKAVTAPTDGSTKWPLYGDEEIAAVTELLKNPNYEPVEQFEEAWKEYHDCPYAKAHCNGTSALTSMWFALNLPPGSEVLVTAYSTWFPVVPMRFFDLVPVFVDANPRTLNIDLEDCKRRLTSKTKAIMPVHWYGLPCDMDEICDFAKEHGLEVVEDASHAHGARLKDQLMGKWGRIAGFSMQATKPLPAIEGGIAMYKNRDDYERATTYGNYRLPITFPEDSQYRKYQGTALGSKLRIHPASAILAKIQLKGLDERNAAGCKQMRRLNDRITQLPGLSEPFTRPRRQTGVLLEKPPVHRRTSGGHDPESRRGSPLRRGRGCRRVYMDAAAHVSRLPGNGVGGVTCPFSRNPIRYRVATKPTARRSRYPTSPPNSPNWSISTSWLSRRSGRIATS